MSHPSSTGPFDPSDPPRLEPLDGGLGRVVALSVSARGCHEGWGVSIAAALARAWGRAQGDVVLIDASFQTPGLAAWLGTEEAPGLAEALDGTSTVQQAVQAVDRARFSLIPAGRAPSDPSVLLKSERWRRLCETFANAGVTLVVYTPADTAWASLIAASASDVFGITSPEESLPLDAVPAHKLRTMLTPPASRAESIKSIATGPGEEDLLDPLAIDPFARSQPPHGTSGPMTVEGSAAPGDPHRPETPGRSAVRPDPRLVGRRAPGSGDFARSLLHAAALAAVVVGVLAWTGWWSGHSGGNDGSVRSLVTDTAAALAPADSGGLTASGPAAQADRDTSTGSMDSTSASGQDPESSRTSVGLESFSIAVASYRDPGTARRHAERIAARWDTVMVIVTPVDVGGDTFHRVLAGSYGDSVQAEAARVELDRATDESGDAWVVRRSQLAFEMGLWDATDDAAAHVERLRASGIDSYVLWDPGPGEPQRFRVYAGAFGAAEEATALETLLTAHELSAILTIRRGSARPFTMK